MGKKTGNSWNKHTKDPLWTHSLHVGVHWLPGFHILYISPLNFANNSNSPASNDKYMYKSFPIFYTWKKMEVGSLSFEYEPNCINRDLYLWKQHNTLYFSLLNTAIKNRQPNMPWKAIPIDQPCFRTMWSFQISNNSFLTNLNSTVLYITFPNTLKW